MDFYKAEIVLHARIIFFEKMKPVTPIRNYSEPVPFRIDESGSEYMRIKYQFIPISIQGDKTQSRTLVFEDDQPDTGYIYHKLDNGTEVEFKGLYEKKKEDAQDKDYVLVFKENEVVMVPIESSLTRVSKVTK